jgi:hypothetical protein
MSFVSTKLGQFRYFDQQLGRPDWRAKSVLDFGGNCGTTLRDPGCKIDQRNYWCVDVSRDAIESGRRFFPNAHWFFYNRYNFEFNINGIKGLPLPRFERRFDFILAYSVFTHTTRAEMIEIVGQLRSLLSDRGVLAFTFLAPRWSKTRNGTSNLLWRLKANKGTHQGMDLESMLEKAKGADWLTLVNGELLVNSEWENMSHFLSEANENSDSRHLHSHIVLYEPEYMKEMFPESEIMSPASPERQHCCAIRK